MGVKTIKINLKSDHIDFDQIVFFLKSNGFYRVFVEAGINFNNFLLENNYINDLYHFYSSKMIGKNGFFNAKLFFKKMNKIILNKRIIRVNLYQDKLIKYLLK